MTDHRDLDVPVRRQRLARWAGPAAVLLSGLIIAVSVDMGASRLASQRYQVAGDGRTVWRLDTRTGEIVRCAGPVGLVTLAAGAPRPPATSPEGTAEPETTPGEQRGSNFPFPLPHRTDGSAPEPADPAPAGQPDAPSAEPESGTGPFGLPFNFGANAPEQADPAAPDARQAERVARPNATQPTPPVTTRPAATRPPTTSSPPPTSSAPQNGATVGCEVVEADALRRRR